ncbi:hypothetical protein [Bdellovibrio sp. HCB337]|uniref:hypothetical protein n=1 Tax=Bdellovibrio sp. HCB337 TaxID=3394358 RepID=UPI0039A5B6C2
MLLTPTLKLLFAPIDDDSPRIPGFAGSGRGEADENAEDEKEILSDQDLTEKIDFASDDENMGAHSNALDSLEEEPEDFLEGEVDVKEQMDRAADAMEASIFGYQNQGTEDSPRTELGAAFKYTPGGIEEVEMKTDQEMARHRHPVKRKHPEGGPKEKR